MREEPTTPEGRLIKYRRERLKPTPTQPETAARLGWKTGKYIQVELGRGIARRGKPAQERRPTDADLVAIAVELGITPEELENVERTDAAARLREHLGAPAPALPDAGLLAAADDFFDAMLVRALNAGAAADPVIVRMWYRSFDAEGRLKPLEVRMREVAAWVNTPRGTGAETAEGTG